MLYLWEMIKNCPQKLIAVYNSDLSPDRFLFMDGVKLQSDNINKKPIFDISVTTDQIEQYDCIPNNSASPLVNEKIVNLLFQLSNGDIQFFDTEVRCKNGALNNYKLLNITSTIMELDHENSIYTKLIQSDAILGFKYCTYKPTCMKGHKLARDKEYLGHILATEEIQQAFKKEKIKGVRFITPEDYYSSLYRKV